MSRLFACACCRRIWPILTEPEQRAAVEAAERAADKLLPTKQLATFQQAAKPLRLGVNKESVQFDGIGSRRGWCFFVTYHANGDLTCNTGGAANDSSLWGHPSRAANDALALLYHRTDKKKADQELKHQVQLLHDLVGPIAPPAIKPSWLTANDGFVSQLAQKIYNQRTFGQLPKLADALEAVGCKDKVLLAHLRSRGPHARGCWAVDLLLGKK